MYFPPALTFAYGVVAAAELYFFLMQRSALEVGREHGIDQQASRHMLPSWYALVWPTKLAKWVLLYLVYRATGFPEAVLLWAVPFGLSAIVPVPHAHFYSMFRSKLSNDIATAQEGPAAELMLALLRSSKAQ